MSAPAGTRQRAVSRVSRTGSGGIEREGLLGKEIKLDTGSGSVYLGLLSDVQALAGLAAIEMAMADLDYPIEPGAGVAAAQGWYRESASNPPRG